MDRGISDRNILEKFCEDFCRIAEKHCKYIIVSGFVAIASGRTRATEDIDMIIERLPREKFIVMHNDLENNGFECLQSTNPEEIYSYLINENSIRYTLKENKLFPPEMEVKFVKDALDEWQLKERQKISFIGLDVWFSSINFNIAFKEEWLGTDKDCEDANHLREIYKGDISNDEIEKIKKMIIHLRKKE